MFSPITTPNRSRMSRISERLSQLFKTPAETKIAQDFLEQKLSAPTLWAGEEAAVARADLASAVTDPERLRAWCARWLSADQVQVLLQVLRMAAQHQRVYKRTVMLSPRAHLLVKTLAELEGLNMSEVIERHLDQVLGDAHGMTLRTLINEQSGQIDHDILPLSRQE